MGNWLDSERRFRTYQRRWETDGEVLIRLVGRGTKFLGECLLFFGMLILATLVLGGLLENIDLPTCQGPDDVNCVVRE